MKSTGIYYSSPRRVTFAKYLCTLCREMRESVISKISTPEGQQRVRERYYHQRALLIAGLPVEHHEFYLNRVHESEREHVERHLIALAQGEDHENHQLAS